MALLPRWHSGASINDIGSVRGEVRTEPGIIGGEVMDTKMIGSLLEKYTFRETVKTVIEEKQLPELPAFLESIGLGGKLDVSGSVPGCVCACSV